MTVRQRLESKFQVTPGCWNWTGRLGHYGYAHLSVNGDGQRAHRLSYELYVGSIPEGMLVCHRCDNRKCVNPDHLFLGTNADNMRDMAAKWRCRSKLTAEQVRQIRADGRILKEIAKDFGVSPSNICRVKKGEYWPTA